MKRIAIFVLAAILLVSVLTACSGTAYVEGSTDRGYSNVSTTDDGTVNGTNGYRRSNTTGSDYANGNTGYGAGSSYRGTNGTMTGSGRTTNDRTYGTTGTDRAPYGGSTYGMTGSGSAVSGNGMSAGAVSGQ